MHLKEGKRGEANMQGRPPGSVSRVLQLVAYDHNSSSRGRDVILQFGKLRSGLYALDFTAPFSARVAFAVAMACIETRMCYTVVD
ncbi:MAG: hypothetical protein WDW38_005446 [Sanguina aurantia]